MNTVKASLSLSLTMLFLIPAAASAEIVTMHFDTDAELLALLSDTIFVAEGRIGDRGGAATFELDLGTSTSAPAASAQYNWMSGQVESFTLSYNSMTGLVTYTLGGEMLYFTTPYTGFEEIFIRTRAVNAGTTVDVYDLVLDGEAVMDSSNADGSGSGLDILLLHGAILGDGFTLTGKAVMSWTGTPPTQSRLAFQLKVAMLGGVGTEETTWGAIKSLFR